MPEPEARRGRPPAASAAEVARAGLRLFVRQGYASTTMADVAAAAGIGRSTLFRYYPTKASLVWSGAQESGRAITAALLAVPAQHPWRPALVEVVVEALVFPDDDLEALRWRLRLITSEPALRAHLAEAGGPAAEAVRAFVADRTGAVVEDLQPRAVAAAVLAATTTALAWWATRSGEQQARERDPRSALRRALGATLLER